MFTFSEQLEGMCFQVKLNCFILFFLLFWKIKILNELICIIQKNLFKLTLKLFFFWAGLIRAWGDTHEWIKGRERIIFGSAWEVLWFHALNESKPWASLIMLSICLTFYPEVCAAVSMDAVVSKALTADWNMEALPNYYLYIRSCKSLHSGWHWQLSQPYVTSHKVARHHLKCHV